MMVVMVIRIMKIIECRIRIRCKIVFFMLEYVVVMNGVGCVVVVMVLY